MTQYYCHECGIKLGIIPGNIDNFNPTGNVYQLEKYYKHTVPPVNPGVISVFDLNEENKKYKKYIINTMASGCVEIDNQDRVNVVWVAGRTTGWEYQDGMFNCEDDAVKVVLHDDEARIHGFPTGSASLRSQTCIECGADIIQPDE